MTRTCASIFLTSSAPTAASTTHHEIFREEIKSLINIFQKAYARKINMAAENALREYEHVLPQANDIRNALWSYRQMQEGKQEPLDEDGVILSKGNIQKQIRKNVATLDTLEKRMHQLGSVLKAKTRTASFTASTMLMETVCRRGMQQGSTVYCDRGWY
jgi:hypothetical protein